MNQLATIRAIFAEQLLSYQSQKVQWENVGGQLPAGDFLRFTFFQDTINQATLGRYGKNERTGTVQVDVFEANDKGIIPALDKANDIEQIFYRGFAAKRDGIVARITKTQVEHQVPDDTHFHIPVSVHWRSHTDPRYKTGILYDDGLPLWAAESVTFYANFETQTYVVRSLK